MQILRALTLTFMGMCCGASAMYFVPLKHAGITNSSIHQIPSIHANVSKRPSRQTKPSTTEESKPLTMEKLDKELAILKEHLKTVQFIMKQKQ